MRDTRFGRRITIAGLFCLSFMCVAICRGATPKERSIAAVNASASFAGKAAVAKDIGLNALRNAIAVCNEKQEKLISALKNGDIIRIDAEKEAWEAAVKDMEGAAETVEKIAKYTEESVAAYSTSRDEAARTLKAENEKEAESAARKAEKQVTAAEKASKNAESLSESLKKKWLIPPPTAPAAPTSPTPSTQPAASVPVENK